MTKGNVIIVGAFGQDGLLLSSTLASQGLALYRVGRDFLIAPDGSRNPFSVQSSNLVDTLVESVKPKFIFYLAAYHRSAQQVGHDNLEEYLRCHETHALGFLKFLEAVRLFSGDTRVFYASSSLIFDGDTDTLQNEKTPASPANIYGLTKLEGMNLAEYYYRSYGIYISCGILYTHESVHRPNQYFSKKIISGAYRIWRGSTEKISVGSLDSLNDWGYAQDYVNAFIAMLNKDTAGNNIIATGELHSAREFADIVFRSFNLDYQEWIIEKPNILQRNAMPRCGDSRKLFEETGWKPSLSFREMIEKLVKEYSDAIESSQ